MQYLYQRSQTGTRASCQGNKAAGIRERIVAANRHQDLHYTDFSDQEDSSMDNVALFLEEHTFAKLFEEE